MHNNYKLNNNILKPFIRRNILLTDPNKKIKHLILYNKFKASNLVINNNTIGVLQKKKKKKTHVKFQFKCLLGGYFSDNKNIYVGLISITSVREKSLSFYY